MLMIVDMEMYYPSNLRTIWYGLFAFRPIIHTLKVNILSDGAYCK